MLLLVWCPIGQIPEEEQLQQQISVNTPFEGLVCCPKILVVIIDVIGPDGDAPVLSSDGGSEMLWRQCFAKVDSQYFIQCVSF
jgi:hypothetical protein